MQIFIIFGFASRALDASTPLMCLFHISAEGTCRYNPYPLCWPGDETCRLGFADLKGA